MEERNQTLWYFAFGSNLNPKILTGFRNVTPAESHPCFLPGWYLNFDTVGLPYYEPSYASIGQHPILQDQPEVHGVVHQITREDYDRIKATELGGEHDDIGYASVPVTVHTYECRQLKALTLVEVPQTVYHGQFYPSKRYMELIEEGAAEFNLKQSYIEWLKTIPRFVPPEGILERIGKYLFLGIILLCAVPLWVPLWWGRFTAFRAPRWSLRLQKLFILVLAHIYYFLFRPIFGAGAGEPITTRQKRY